MAVLVASCVLGALEAACLVTTSLDGLTCSPGSCPDDGATATEAGPSPGADASADTATMTIPPVADPDGLGDGHMGSKHIVAQESVNSYAALLFDAAIGAASIDIDSIGPLVDGDRMLVWQTNSEELLVGAGTLDLSGFRAGSYELVRAQHVTANAVGASVQLTAPLAHAFTAKGTQVVRVAEYTDLTIDSTGSLVAPAWDGRVGGIVAVLVRGTLRADGAITVDALGLRGGVTYTNAGPYTCGTQNGLWKDGYAAKGEGLVRSAYYPATATGDPGTFTGGRPNETSGGGGGVCHNSGAGGGGNGSAGGQGGHDYDSNGVGRDVGGLGGLAITFSVKDRLVLGGGGGAGDRHATVDTTGARGGGVIFVRAHDLIAGGAITANGAGAGPTNHDGAGGGGAGGTIVLSILGDATCAQPITATGGAGGSTTMGSVGPGGGGGGGHVMFTAQKTSCSFNVSSGIAGTQANLASAFGAHYGATPAAAVAGVVEAP